MTKTLPNPYELGGCVYYSQNREDLTLLSFFADESKGFYVDVGAFDPDVDSVTKLFYLNGWHGINIEPQLAGFKLFEKYRKRDINLNLGIAATEDTLKLRAYSSGGLSTFSNSVKQEYENNPDADTRQYQEFTVSVVPLKKVFATHNVSHISFMKVDVEGFEYEVLSSNDWERYRPEVLCIESNHIEKDWRPLLQEAGYIKVFNDGLNDYYADSRTDRAQKFNFVKEVVHDRGGGIRADHYQLLLDWTAFAKHKASHVEELAADNERLLAKIASQDAAWNDLKQTTKRAAYLAKSAIRKSKK